METREPNNETGKAFQQGRVGAGIFLLVVGVLWMFSKAGFILLPEWLFTWPMILILMGIVIAIKHRFNGGGWIAMLLLGGFFLADENIPEMDVKRFLVPLIIICAGLFMLIKPKHYMGGDCGRFPRERWRRRRYRDLGINEPIGADTGDNASKDDVIDSLSVFGGVRKIVLSKNFRGGEITSVMGGTEVDFSQADINGQATLEVTSVMGATKLVIPPHWHVKSDVTAVLGALEDKRNIQGVVFDPNKVLNLKGVSFLGGLEITSY